MSSSTSRQPRIPFTPKRPGSSLSVPSKIKAALSSEARTRHATSKPSIPKLSTSPRKTPVERAGTPSARAGTPGTPRLGPSPSPSLFNSALDPEENLVDSENVEVDLSGEIDENELRFAKESSYGASDRVLVSIRVKPVSGDSAWKVDMQTGVIKLNETYARHSTVNPPDFRFDEVHTGSENKSVYNAVARSHVCAAMDGYNSTIFAYGQTASGKTFTLTGDETQPGIIPRAMKDIFGYIKRTPDREFLLRCSYLEIYNEQIHDLLAPPSSSYTVPVTLQGVGSNVVITPLREEVVTSLKAVREVLARGDASRRTACTDWNERSSRSHSVFRVVIESRERSSGKEVYDRSPTPGGTVCPPTPGGSRLQARGGRTVQMSVLSLIDLAGSEKATSDKERTREGKYINTSLLTLGTVIATLAENATKGKSDHVPYRNSKLTRMLQPALSGNARISVICTISPAQTAIAESTSTLHFAQRIKKVQLKAEKHELVDTEALLERYRSEIDDLRKRLADREDVDRAKSRRLSAREQVDESRAMKDLHARIAQLTKLIVTSQTVEDTNGDESRPASPVKLDFDLSPYQLQQELLGARRQMETQANQILSLEAALAARPALPVDAPEADKDRLITEQAKTIRELEIVVAGYEDNLGEPLRAVKEDVEKEWKGRLEEQVRRVEEKEEWASELVRQLEKEKQARIKLEGERKALASFVTKFDSLGLSDAERTIRAAPHPAIVPGGAAALYAGRRKRSTLSTLQELESVCESPVRMSLAGGEPSLVMEQMVSLPGEDEWESVGDCSFTLAPTDVGSVSGKGSKAKGLSRIRGILGASSKENVPIGSGS